MKLLNAGTRRGASATTCHIAACPGERGGDRRSDAATDTRHKGSLSRQVYGYSRWLHT